MKTINVITPPASIVKNNILTTTIFLAGSIEMGSSQDWQAQVISFFKDREPFLELRKKELTFFNPRRENWDSSWTQSIESPNFYQQVNWELNSLDKADYIIMHFEPSTKSPISLLELGLYAKSSKILVSCPPGFWRKGNVDIVCEKFGIPNYDNLDDLLNNLYTLIIS
jgi:hypothetical protein